MVPADGLYGVQVFMSLVHCIHSVIWGKVFSPPFFLHRNVDKIGVRIALLFYWLLNVQHARVSQGRICTDNFTCCHSEIEVADQAF